MHVWQHWEYIALFVWLRSIFWTKKVHAWINSQNPSKFCSQTQIQKTEILLKGINLDQTEPDHRNKQITFVVQNYILKTGRFSEKYFALERAQPQPNCPFVGIATRSPPLWLVLVSPFPKWLRACCGWGDAGVAWSRVRLNFCTQR